MVKAEFLAGMLSLAGSPYLRLTIDIGNVFIAGQDPIQFGEQFHDKISHVHVKDISQELASEARCELTWIAGSHRAIGAGIHDGNVEQCVKMLAGYGYRGVLTIECEAEGSLIEGSLAWMRKLLPGFKGRASYPVS